MPMMQFSLAPWRVDDEYIDIIVKYAKLHSQLGDYIYDLALRSKETGEPIVKPLFFRNPEDENTYTIADQFLLGDKFLVAPVTTENANSRDIYLPQGSWVDFWNETVYQGGQTI
jgi:alpha-glucosidase